MGRKIVWSLEALELLEGIMTYWEKRNGTRTYALRLNNLFQETLKQIAKYPNSGRSTKNQGVKYRIVKDYFIYYTFNDSMIEVVSLCDMRRDPEYIKSLLE